MFNTDTHSSDLSSFSKPDLVAEIVIFTAASLDGVAAFISPFMNNMLQRPEIHHRVMAEIDAADQRGELSLPVSTYEETTKLKYFMACVKETLRYNSPAVTLLPRIVSNPGYNLKIDNNGNILWSKDLSRPFYSYQAEVADVAATPGNGFVIVTASGAFQPEARLLR